jgi:hypothetical protein
MRRRTVLSGLAVSLPLALAGCTGDSGPDDPGRTDSTDEQSETETPSDEPDTPDGTVTPGRVSATLVPREECPNPGEATVSFGDEAISIVGCVVGNNGCNVQRLRNVDYDTETGALTVVVAAVDESGEYEQCTQQLVNLGYEVDVETDGTSVTSVRVVHDNWEGRKTVVDVTR